MRPTSGSGDPRHRRLVLVAALLAVFALVSLNGCSDDEPTDAMTEDLDALELPTEFRFEAERRHAADECQVPCPRAAHYYSSDLESTDACIALADPVRAWADDTEELPDVTNPESSRCGFEGTADSGLYEVAVFADLEIEAGVGHMNTEQIDTPHNSVVRITINS